jgi:hypothetical protein
MVLFPRMKLVGMLLLPLLISGCASTTITVTGGATFTEVREDVLDVVLGDLTVTASGGFQITDAVVYSGSGSSVPGTPSTLPLIAPVSVGGPSHAFPGPTGTEHQKVEPSFWVLVVVRGVVGGNLETYHVSRVNRPVDWPSTAKAFPTVDKQ